MWSFLNNSRGPLTVSPPNNNHPAVTKVAAFHVSSYSRGILDLASNPCHKQFPDFINRSNSASELVVCSGEKLSPDTVNRSKSASELSPCSSSMGGKSDDGSPSRAASPSATSSLAKAEKPASPSPKKRRCNLQKQQQQEEQTQQQSEEAEPVAVPVESGDEEDDDSSSDEDMVPLKVRQRNDSLTSEDSFIIFEDSSDGADEKEDEEEDESDESDTESEDSDSDSSGDDTAEEICFENSPRCVSCVSTTSKKVHWAPDDELCSVTQITTWPQAHWEARISPWLIMAVDTMRFKTRILSTQPILDDILSTQHRAKIYEERFKNQD